MTASKFALEKRLSLLIEQIDKKEDLEIKLISENLIFDLLESEIEEIVNNISFRVNLIKLHKPNS